jgi:hypothetical protein
MKKGRLIDVPTLSALVLCYATGEMICTLYNKTSAKFMTLVFA